MAVSTINAAIASKSFENIVLSLFSCGVIWGYGSVGIDKVAGASPAGRRSVADAEGKEGRPSMLLADLPVRSCGC